MSKFWSELAELIKTDTPHSHIHDIALMNCPIPTIESPPSTPVERGLFGAQIFDEAVKRIYEMLVLLEWYEAYRISSSPKEVRKCVSVEAD